MKTPGPKINAQAHLNTTKHVPESTNIMKRAQEEKNTNKKNFIIQNNPRTLMHTIQKAI